MDGEEVSLRLMSELTETITIHDRCGKPVVRTFEWRYYEYMCMVCGTHHEEFDDTLSDVPMTDELIQDRILLKIQYDEERKQRKYDGTR